MLPDKRIIQCKHNRTHSHTRVLFYYLLQTRLIADCPRTGVCLLHQVATRIIIMMEEIVLCDDGNNGPVVVSYI